jgi:hypothetical protein
LISHRLKLKVRVLLVMVTTFEEIEIY